MYILDNIAYAGEPVQPARVKAVRPLTDYKLLVLFTTGERKVFDLEPFLSMPCYKLLSDKNVFDRVFVECGTLNWNNGEIDIAPETVYEKSTEYSGKGIA